MKPEARLWRKNGRAAARGVKRGRRSTHTAVTETSRRGSTWERRNLSQQRREER
jgi:hypothetical protein